MESQKPCVWLPAAPPFCHVLLPFQRSTDSNGEIRSLIRLVNWSSDLINWSPAHWTLSCDTAQIPLYNQQSYTAISQTITKMHVQYIIIIMVTIILWYAYCLYIIYYTLRTIYLNEQELSKCIQYNYICPSCICVRSASCNGSQLWMWIPSSIIWKAPVVIWL